MLATAEAFKLLAGYTENPPRAMIEIDFDGYETRFAPICDRNSDVGAVVERHDSFAADILGPSPTQNA